MPDLGAPEIIIIIIVLLLLFGASRLPQTAKGIGQAMRIFKKELRDEDKDKKAAGQLEGDQQRPAPATERAYQAYQQPAPQGYQQPAPAPQGYGQPPVPQAPPQGYGQPSVQQAAQPVPAPQSTLVQSSLLPPPAADQPAADGAARGSAPQR